MTEALGRLYGRCHSLPDPLLYARLDAYLFHEADATPWWAMLQRSDGRLYVLKDPRVGGDDGIAPPESEKQYFARNLLIELNRRCAYRGAWVVFWCEGADGYQRLGYLWKDHDGDRQILCDTDDAWPRVKRVGVDKWVEDGDAAIRKWHLIQVEAMKVRPDQTIKAAQGQTRPE